jgi:hypothetical protein
MADGGHDPATPKSPPHLLIPKNKKKMMLLRVKTKLKGKSMMKSFVSIRKRIQDHGKEGAPGRFTFNKK